MASDDIHCIEGPVLVLSGPGTGKTHKLAKRIKYLIEVKQIPPNNITVITFTGAAAQNMRDRISDDSKPELYIPYMCQPKLICTMHSLGYRIIRECSEELGLERVVRIVHDDNLRSILVGDAAQLSGYLRDTGIETVSCRQFGDCKPNDETKCQICNTYKRILRNCSALDYDEQILLACEILEQKPELLKRYRESTSHLLIDEYQDINASQFRLIHLLSEMNLAGLFVVGDDDQSIYSWRGGSPEYIRRFRQDFGGIASVVMLQKSFRCHKHLIEGALNIVEKYDDHRYPKKITEYKVEDGLKIRVHSAPSDEKEAKEVRHIIENALPSQDCLVLFPNRQFSKAIIKELRSARIPFTSAPQMPGEGLSLVSTLATWLTNSSDSLSLRECIEAYLESPNTDVPSKRVRKTEKKDQREAAFKLISELWKVVIEDREKSLWDALKLNESAADLYFSAYTAFSRLIDLHGISNNMEEFFVELARNLSPWRKVDDFLSESSSWVELLTYYLNSSQGINVRLMTFQGAKGLEARVVCVIGLEEGIIPRISDADKIEEQSRLLFVTMTRAVNELHLFHARKRSGNIIQRNIYSKDGRPDLCRSRFIDAINKEHREEYYHPA